MTTNPPGRWTEELDRLEGEALAEVNRLWTLAQVLSSTVHSVKNSLQVTGGNAELMEGQAGLDPALLRRAQTIRTQSMRAADALEALLAYARPASPEAESVDVAELVKGALEMRAYALSRARITVETRGTDAGMCVTTARRRLLLQLVLNLLLATESGIAGRTGAKIQVELQRDGTALRMRVTGSGVPTTTEAEGPSGEFGRERLSRVIEGLASALGVGLEQEDAEGGPRYSVTLPIARRLAG